MKHRILTLFLTLLMVCSACVMPAAAAEPAETEEVFKILFTHDLHSHFLPQAVEGGGESGGYARLKTAIDRERGNLSGTLLVDAGDFSIGSLIQTLYTEQAAELRTMGEMGYDFVAIGNHEFDHGSEGFANMLNAAKMAQLEAIAVLADSQYPNSKVDAYTDRYGPLTAQLPVLLASNYIPGAENAERAFVEDAMENYGVQEHALLERDGITYGIFSLMGQDSHDCAPTSGFELLAPVEQAKTTVAKLNEAGAEFIICLSHSGTGDSLAVSEDEVLAAEVDGIDLIVSGHTHTTLTEPIVVNDTYIVSAGPYCQNLGSISFQKQEDGGIELVDYKLIPIDETLPEDPEIAAIVEEWKTMVGEGYLKRYGLTYDQVLTTTEYSLKTPVSGVQEGNALGELVADSFLWAVENLEADAPNVDTVSVTADGVLRANLSAGDITTSQAFDVLSMGVGADGTSGFPLVGVYLTGKELKAAAEVDASVTPIMPAAQLYMGGMRYAFNTHRMFFNRVTETGLMIPPFSKAMNCTGDEELEDDKLYRVVTGMYSAQMLGTVKSKSMGLLSLEPKMADGSPVTDFNDCILRDAEGNEIKEWYALAAYLQSFGEEGLPQWYARSDGRKEVSRSWNPLEHIVNLNWISGVVFLVLAILILLVVLAVRLAVRRSRRKKKKREEQ